jgi:mRNA interferase MazF
MHRPGDIILAKVHFTDTFEVKTRPALVLFEEYDNVVVAGVTSNLEMKGIPISKKEGLMKDSVIKLNYIFTISSVMIEKKLLSLSKEKRKIVQQELVAKLNGLNA